MLLQRLKKRETHHCPPAKTCYAATITLTTKIRQSESEVAQSCPTLCDPMDCSPAGSSVHGIFQA